MFILFPSSSFASFFVASGVNLGFLTIDDLQLVQAKSGVDFAASHCNAYAAACSGFNITSYQTYYEPIYYPGMSLIYWYALCLSIVLLLEKNKAIAVLFVVSFGLQEVRAVLCGWATPL